MQGEQEVLVELEGGGELEHHLPHTLQELREDGRGVSGVSSQVPIPGGGRRGEEGRGEEGDQGDEGGGGREVALPYCRIISPACASQNSTHS